MPRQTDAKSACHRCLGARSLGSDIAPLTFVTSTTTNTAYWNSAAPRARPSDRGERPLQSEGGSRGPTRSLTHVSFPRHCHIPEETRAESCRVCVSPALPSTPAMVAPGACFRRLWRRLRCCWHAWPSRAASSLAPAVAVRASWCGLFEVAPSAGCGCVQAVAWMHETRQQATSPDERLSGGADARGRRLEELERIAASLKAGSHARFSQWVGSSRPRKPADEAVVRIADTPLEDQPVLLLSEVQRVDHLVVLKIESVRVDVLGVVEEIPPALPG